MAIDAIKGQAPQVTGAIRAAAHSTGMSFDYLLATARIESSLNPAAQAATSSATGLYQFIEQTWLATMKAAGNALGYGHYADAIVQNPSGQYEVPDPAARSAIMRLRNDPTASALMAGAFARQNAARLAPVIGRTPSENELYIAHFLGADGAGKLISAAATQPQASAAAMFPQAAAANPSIFYGSGGTARSIGEVYVKLTDRFDLARGPGTADAPLRGSVDAPGVTDPSAMTQALVLASKTLPPPPPPAPLVRSIFSDRTPTVTHAVNQLWTTPTSDTGGARPASLFTDMPQHPARKPLGS